MSRSRRILELLNPSVLPQNDLNFEITDTNVNTHLRKKRQREPSPLPAGFEDELVQLEDLIGDIFDDSPRNLVGDISDIMNPSNVNPVTQPKTPTPSVSVPDILVTTSNSPKVLETNENEVFIQIYNTVTTSMPSSSPTSWLPNDGGSVNIETPSQISSVDDALPTYEIYENMGTPSEISSAGHVHTPSSTTSSRKKSFKTDKGKKRLAHKERWIFVQRKLKKNSGEEFINKKGKMVKRKELKSL